MSRGLGSYAERIVEDMGAESVDDLRFVDEDMTEQVVKDLTLPHIPARKFREAMASVRIAAGGRSVLNTEDMSRTPMNMSGDSGGGSTPGLSPAG